MKTPFWIFKVNALNAVNAETVLYFANGEYIDAALNYYQIRILQPSLINVSPNDGGLLPLFGESSIGEVELANIDGQLDFLADYALDGRQATLWQVNHGVETLQFTGTIGRMTERGNSIFFALKALTESLANNHPLGDPYAGDNVLPLGLEGTDDDIGGKIKPRVYGDCRNVSPIPVNTAKLIYQASSKNDCVITAVYDEGVRLTNYKVNGSHAAGTTTIAVDTGAGGISAGAQVMFDSHRTIYTVSTGLSAGNIVLSMGLEAAIADHSAVEVVNFYTGTGTGATELQSTTVAAAWGSYQGYLRLANTPAGVITCDAMSVSSGLLHQAGDVLNELATEVSLSVDTASVTALNTVGVIGIYVDADISTGELFNKLMRSLVAYYWFDAGVLYCQLLAAPKPVADLVIEDFMIIEVSREATGIGSNGIPIHGVKIQYDRVETVQTTVAGSVAVGRRERLAHQYREKKLIDGPTKTRYLLSESITIESHLRKLADAIAVSTRLKDIGKVRRDVISILCDRSVLPTFAIGQTAQVKKLRLGYENGRNMVIIGFELDAKKDTLRLRCFG